MKRTRECGFLEREREMDKNNTISLSLMWKLHPLTYLLVYICCENIIQGRRIKKQKVRIQLDWLDRYYIPCMGQFGCGFKNSCWLTRKNLQLECSCLTCLTKVPHVYMHTHVTIYIYGSYKRPSRSIQG